VKHASFVAALVLCGGSLTGVLSGRAAAGGYDEFKVKRKGPFAFAQKPKLRRRGDRITISFATKAHCDVTVAVENAAGKIVRHLACGVLGDKAPPPLRKGSLEQELVWDGKDDQGRYIDDKESHSVRVSLGLDPVFEKDLFSEPKRRHGREAPIFQVAEEGVYVYDGGNALDFVELYGHDGKYLRTVYPFPADKISKVRGLNMRTYPQDGLTLPIKPTFLQQTFLTCGNFYDYEHKKQFRIKAIPSYGSAHYGMYGSASSILAVGGGRLALGKMYLFRMATDGSSGGMKVEGPSISLITRGTGRATRGKDVAAVPRSAALSPDGKTLYLTGYNFCHYGKASNDIVTSGKWETFHCVMKKSLADDEPVKLFAGSLKKGVPGSEAAGFKVPASVATDKAGRVYVADYMNDRVQIFSPGGKLLKSVRVSKPAVVSINGKTGELYVFTALVYNIFLVKKAEKIRPALTVFGPFGDLEKRASCPLPKGYGGGRVNYLYSGMGFPLSAAVDGYTDPPTVWLANEWRRENVLSRGKIRYHNMQLFSFKGGRLELKRDFGAEVAKSVKRARPAPYARPRLYFNPGNGRLYVGEGEAYVYKSFKTLIEINPDTGRIRIVPIPFDAEDMCFDHNGFAYLRTINVVARYNPGSWREIPWDYGEERKRTYTSSSSDRKEADVISGLVLPANGGWHHGGMFVSLRGYLAVACGYHVELPKEKTITGGPVTGGRTYMPPMYPGRAVGGRGGAPLIHVWDKHGKLQLRDVVPGISGQTYGIGLDQRNAVYMMSSCTRIIDGKRYPNKLSGTLIKVVPGRPRLVSRDKGKLKLSPTEAPKRSPDLVGSGMGTGWAKGVEWMYGGVGYDGKNAGVGCACWNARATFDYFARSFAPELDRYRVAVLDSAGNLILRIGRYGNRDSAGPKSRVPLGGDEVGMTHGAYLAVDTDRRLFVADPANDRIFSVRLGYRATERVALKDVPDEAKRSER
jgi:hypothetical protein